MTTTITIDRCFRCNGLELIKVSDTSEIECFRCGQIQSKPGPESVVNEATT